MAKIELQNLTIADPITGAENIPIQQGTALKRIPVAALPIGTSVAFKGAAVAATDPGAPTGPEYYIATAAGTYTNFKDSTGAALEVTAGEFAIFSFNGASWVKQTVTISLSDYAKSSDVLSTAEYVKYSDNLIDNSTILAGLYLSNGSVDASTDSIRTPFIELRAGESALSLSGVGETINSYAVRFSFFKSDNSFISYSNTLINVSIPANAAFVGVTIAYASGIGNDPTNSAYKKSMMLNYGATVLPYVPFGHGIDAAKIDPAMLDAIIENSSSVSGSKTFIDDIKYISNNLFDKTKATSGSISASGGYVPSTNWCKSDFISIVESTKYSTSGHSPNATTSLAIAFYNSNKVFISGVQMSGQTKYTTTSPAGSAYMMCTIANSLNIGTTPTDNSYVNAFMVNEGDPKDWEPGPDKSYINAKSIYGIKQAANYPNVFIDFKRTGSPSSKELFTIYTRRGSTNKYVGFDIRHDYDMSELVYTDQYRIGIAKEYLYDGINMNKLSSDLLIVEGESECVYQRKSASDFTGGVHGDEIYNQINFYVDGIPMIDLSSDFLLRACDKFEYIQISTTHQTSTDGVNPVTGHPAEATHHKRTVFENGGYHTFNRLIWLDAIPINLWYHGICCMGKYSASVVFNEQLVQQAMTGSNTEYFNVIGPREYNGYNPSTASASQIKSTLLMPSTEDEGCVFFVWDRTGDSKYYRRYTGHTTIVGETWESVMEVSFK